jgi:hypothetical protein
LIRRLRVILRIGRLRRHIALSISALRRGIVLLCNRIALHMDRIPISHNLRQSIKAYFCLALSYFDFMRENA